MDYPCNLRSSHTQKLNRDGHLSSRTMKHSPLFDCPWRWSNTRTTALSSPSHEPNPAINPSTTIMLGAGDQGDQSHNEISNRRIGRGQGPLDLPFRDRPKHQRVVRAGGR